MIFSIYLYRLFCRVYYHIFHRFATSSFSSSFLSDCIATDNHVQIIEKLWGASLSARTLAWEIILEYNTKKFTHASPY